MEKPSEIKVFESPYGEVTIVIDREGEYFLKAYETAEMFGFKDAKECVRKYANDAKLIILPTAGGQQPVKCISFEDAEEISKHSRLDDASAIFDVLLVRGQAMRIKNLQVKNFLLADDLEFAINSLKDLREQLDEILIDLE